MGRGGMFPSAEILNVHDNNHVRFKIVIRRIHAGHHLRASKRLEYSEGLGM